MLSAIKQNRTKELVEASYEPLSMGAGVKEEKAPKPPDGRFTILLVDNEPALVRLGKSILEKAGYSVRDTADPFEALRIFEAYPAGIDLIITDHVMPGLVGLELIKRAKAIHPGVGTIIVTANPFLDCLDEAEKAGLAKVIGKPYFRYELLDAVSAALGPGLPETGRGAP